MNRDSLKHRPTRRTTVTLEADVADYIQETISKNKGLREKELINTLLRRGIGAAAATKAEPLRIEAFKTKLRVGVDTEKIEELLDEI